MIDLKRTDDLANVPTPLPDRHIAFINSAGQLRTMDSGRNVAPLQDGQAAIVLTPDVALINSPQVVSAAGLNIVIGNGGSAISFKSIRFRGFCLVNSTGSLAVSLQLRIGDLVMQFPGFTAQTQARVYEFDGLALPLGNTAFGYLKHSSAAGASNGTMIVRNHLSITGVQNNNPTVALNLAASGATVTVYSAVLEVI
jgi:hypothetical protein